MTTHEQETRPRAAARVLGRESGRRVRGGAVGVDLLGLDGETLWMRAYKPDPLPRGWRLERDGLDGGLYYHESGLVVILSGAREMDGKRWLHVSCSRSSRLPSWEDMRLMKDTFIGPDRYAVQVLPPRDRYVNIGAFVLHLFSPVDGPWPLPEFSGVVAGRRTL